MENKLTPEAALEILTQVAYAHVGNRQTHMAIEQALIVIKGALFPQPQVSGPVPAPVLVEDTPEKPKLKK